MNWDFVVFVFFVALVVALLLVIVNLKIKNKRLAKELLQSTIDHNIVLTMLAEELKKKENVSVEKTDGFLKFISESRDLAFEYIEKIQASLIKFKSQVDPEIKYMLTYGTVSGDNLYLKSFGRIEKAYAELMHDALPSEEEKKN